jgi:hypothetical protein
MSGHQPTDVSVASGGFTVGLPDEPIPVGRDRSRFGSEFPPSPETPFSFGRGFRVVTRFYVGPAWPELPQLRHMTHPRTPQVRRTTHLTNASADSGRILIL